MLPDSHQNNSAPHPSAATRRETTPTDMSPGSNFRRKFSYSDQSEFVFDITDLRLEMCRYFLWALDNISNKAQKRTKKSQFSGSLANCKVKPSNASATQQTQEFPSAHFSRLQESLCEEDFLTSQQRIDAVADILATIALRIAKKGVAHEPTTS